MATQDEKPLHVAIVVAGGVSLGTFCAGALYQVLVRLEELSKTRDVIVDVLCGASAGSMSIALAANALLGGHVLSNETAFKSPWVDEIELAKLIHGEPLAPAFRSGGAVFDVGTIEALARKYLAAKTRDYRSSPLVGDRLVLSFALSNANGIRVRTERQIVRNWDPNDSSYVDALEGCLYADVATFSLSTTGTADPTNDPQSERPGFKHCGAGSTNAWAEIAEIAMASGRFPFAFPPSSIVRGRGDYGTLWPEGLSDPFAFSFLDGGIFDNEPLARAFELADQVDDDLFDKTGTTCDRVFAFVDPTLSGLSDEAEFELPGADSSGSLTPKDFVGGIVKVGSRLVSMLAGQAKVKDWLETRKINNRAKWVEGLGPFLADLVKALPEPAVERLGEDAAVLRRRIAEDKLAGSLRTKALRPGTPDAEESEYTKRLHQRLETDLQVVHRWQKGTLELVDAHEARRLHAATAIRRGLEIKSASTNPRVALLASLLDLLDRGAGLKRKEQRDVFAVTPASFVEGSGARAIGRTIRLAGNFLLAFGGFLDHKWREHDYDVGRACADNVVERDLGPLVGFENSTVGAPCPRLAFRVLKRSSQRLVITVCSSGSLAA